MGVITNFEYCFVQIRKYVGSSEGGAEEKKKDGGDSDVIFSVCGFS